jgi:peroxiredoxin
MARESKVLRVGDRAPAFRLEDAASGRRVALEEYLGKPLMIMFLRGTW